MLNAPRSLQLPLARLLISPLFVRQRLYRYFVIEAHGMGVQRLQFRVAIHQRLGALGRIYRFLQKRNVPIVQ